MKRLAPLHGCVPIGAGTPLVESLSSCLGRFSVAQYLMSSTVCGELVRPLVPEDLRGEVFWRGGLNGQNGVTWDGHNEITEALAVALTELTALPDLPMHTLLPWRRMLPERHSGALRWKRRRWCAACLGEWRAEGTEPWEPLLWRVAFVSRCPVHGMPFSELCPRCLARQGHLPGMTRLGVCRLCGHHLEIDDSVADTGGNASSTDPEERWQRELSQVVGRVLAHQEEMAAHASPRGFLTLLERLLHRSEIGSLRKLSHYVGVHDGALRDWLMGKCLWRMELFFRICMRAGVDPLAVAVYPHRDFSEERGLKRRLRLRVRGPVRPTNSRKAPCRHWGEVGWRLLEEKLAALLEDPDSGRLSVNDVMKRLGVSHTTLKKRYPNEYARFKELHDDYRRRRRDQRIAEIGALLDGACQQLIQQGLRVEQNLVFELAGFSPRFAFNYRCAPIWRRLKRKYGIFPR